MNNCPFCKSDAADAPATSRGGQKSIGLVRRARRGVQWFFPAALLVLMPKCPMCMAAYILLFSGVSITVATAQWIQILMPVLCVMSLAYLTIRWWRSRRVGTVA